MTTVPPRLRSAPARSRRRGGARTTLVPHWTPPPGPPPRPVGVLPPMIRLAPLEDAGDDHPEDDDED
jgi:hypothetical protein